MTDPYLEYRTPQSDVHDDPSFLRPLDNYQPDPSIPGGYAYSQARHASRASAATWISMPQSGGPRRRPLPPQPIPVPPPVEHARGVSEYSDFEYMGVSVDQHAEEEEEVAEEPEEEEVEEERDEVVAAPPPPIMLPGPSKLQKSGRRRFVGGFVSSLKKLPKAMVRSVGREKQPIRRGTTDTYGTGASFNTVDTLPRYHTPIRRVQPPPIPPIHYVEAMDMPQEHPTPAPSHVSRHPTPAPSNRSVSFDSRHPSHESQPSRHNSRHTSHHTHVSEEDEVEEEEEEELRGHTPDIRDGSTTMVHHEGYPPEIHGTTYIHHTPSPRGEPLVVPDPRSPGSPNFRPTSDYDKMSRSIRTTATTLGSYAQRVYQFFKDLNDLPWMASGNRRVAADYIPGDNPRSRYRYSRWRVRDANKEWYTDRRHTLDMLSVGEPSYTRGASTSGYTSTHRRTRHTSRTSDPGPRTHSHSHSRGHTHSRSHTSPKPHSPSASHLAALDPHAYGQISYPYGYTYSPSPGNNFQPMYVYPSSPQAQQHQQPGSPQAMQQAMPVYFVAGLPPPLPPGYIPQSPHKLKQAAMPHIPGSGGSVGESQGSSTPQGGGSPRYPTMLSYPAPLKLAS
ncbi:hypothetical protein JAAARDRAFT_43034 [Jaapia argillacea MUCL 33604]|uniref:Uncharacterized protein n=1 Tax=Jaapia argillacea MUCL 33604 TaxID=933084 RepID=A0A067P5T0_9AGAM|nr:hypothetical protein JAAARDRAFT_43034 [Jaapia argillacea MUCL 33604]